MLKAGTETIRETGLSLYNDHVQPLKLSASRHVPSASLKSRFPKCNTTKYCQHHSLYSQHSNTAKMMRTESNRIESKRRAIDFRKKQFSTPEWKDQSYPHRLNFYTTPPMADITLEQFEQWAIDRLKGSFSI